jgi:hypothetical protein
MTMTRHEDGKRTSSNAAKAAVVAYVNWLVLDGLAQLSKVDGGIELTLSSGEVFLLGETSVTRIV